MMNDMQPGPALDRAVAEAMDPTLIVWDVYKLPPYSTAFGAQTQEMLDWLRRVGAHVELTFHVDRNDVSAEVWVGGAWSVIDATSEPHAWSLLVLAVAEWRQKGVET